jgi:hypothetical protein
MFIYTGEVSGYGWLVDGVAVVATDTVVAAWLPEDVVADTYEVGAVVVEPCGFHVKVMTPLL